LHISLSASRKIKNGISRDVPFFYQFFAANGRVAVKIQNQLVEHRTMRYLGWLLKGALFILLLGFAVRNSDIVTIRYYLGYAWQAPLVLVMLVFFVMGAVVGVAACMGYLFRQRRELVGLRQAAQAQKNLAETAYQTGKNA
jgi:uncharacterized integral membrane protein